MLVLTPYKAPEKKATGKAKGVRSGPCRKGALNATFEYKTRSSAVEDDDDDEEEENNPPPDEGRKKRAASANLEAETSKKGRAPLWITLHGTSTTVQRDAPALSLGPHRKC